jgi:hypothetical protein
VDGAGPAHAAHGGVLGGVLGFGAAGGGVAAEEVAEEEDDDDGAAGAERDGDDDGEAVVGDRALGGAGRGRLEGRARLADLDRHGAGGQGVRPGVGLAEGAGGAAEGVAVAAGNTLLAGGEGLCRGEETGGALGAGLVGGRP